VNPGGLTEFARRPGALTAARALPGLDLCWVGVLALVVSMWIPALRGGALVRERWRWAAVPCLGVMAVYLPVFLMREDQRYFCGLLPFLWVATLGAAGWWLKRRNLEGSKAASRVVSLCFASFMTLALVWCAASLRGLPNAASRDAMELAARMRAAKLSGPIAGHALMQGGRAGLYTAWSLGQPWHGEAADPTPRGFRTSGARFAIVVRGSPLEKALEFDPGFRNLDAEIFGSSGPGARRLCAYEIKPAGAILIARHREAR